MRKTNSRTPSPKFASPDRFVELTIDSLSFNGGRGVGRVDGIVVFVPGTTPGDRIRARVTKTKKNLLEAELVRILEPSPHRRVPPCPVADRCGGCSWQQVTYAEQLVQKQKILRDSLRRLGTDHEELHFLPAPSEFNYRNRIQLHIERGRWGFFAPRTRQLVEFDRCLITEDRINEEMARRSPTEFGDARRVELALTADGDLRVMIGERDPTAALFAQVNTRQNEVMKQRIVDLAIPDVAWFMDLYAGSGNLTSTLKGLYPAADGIAVELSRTSVERGRLGHPSVEWIADDVGRGLAALKPRNGRGVILIDPPRVGCGEDVIAGLERHSPEQIIYVSCNPATFARDAERLIAGRGYRLTLVQGLDMFPQTEHVELIASFRR